MKKITVYVMIITLFSKLLGLFRDMVLSYCYGASNISDAYLVSLTIPTVIFGFIGLAITTNYIPTYQEVLHKLGQEQAKKFMNNLTNHLIIICLIILIIFELIAPYLVKVFALGFQEETLRLAVIFARITMPGILFTALCYMYTGYLNVQNKFIATALLGLPMNITEILGVLLSFYTKKLVFMAYGGFFACVFQALFLLYCSKKAGYQYKLYLNPKDIYLRKMLKKALPVTLGTSINQINKLVDRAVASIVSVGGISALNYANLLNLFVQGILVLPITSVYYPNISKMVIKKEKENIRKTYQETFINLLVLILPASLGILVLSKPITIVLFNRGNFNDEAVNMTAIALFWYSFGMIGAAFREFFSRTFYALRDTIIPTKNAFFTMMMNLILNIVLGKIMGLAGLALATSFSSICCTILLYRSLIIKSDFFLLNDQIKDIIKIGIASIIMMLFTIFLYNSLINIFSLYIALLFSILCSLFIYLIIITILNVSVINKIKSTIINRFI